MLNRLSYPKPARAVPWLCTLAAILYNSWPLGYIFNSHTARYGLASDLERAGQPYYWLFISGDVLTGISVVAASALVWRGVRPKPGQKAWSAMSIGLLVFGLFTAVGTLAPPQCPVASILKCGTDNGRGLGLDGVLSGLAIGGLLMGLISAIVLGRRYALSTWFQRMVQVLLLAWCINGCWFVTVATDGRIAALAQQLFLTLSGLVLLAIGLTISAALRYDLTRSRPE